MRVKKGTLRTGLLLQRIKSDLSNGGDGDGDGGGVGALVLWWRREGKRSGEWRDRF